MSQAKAKIKIGILGCGAIGSRIAHYIRTTRVPKACISAVFDIDHERATVLARSIPAKNVLKKSFQEFLTSCDLVVEAVNAADTDQLIRKALLAQCDVLVMSVGKLIGKESLFDLAQRNKRSLIIPSGAIAGIDAIKAASLGKIKSITLTTRKPLAGFAGNAYLRSKRIDLTKIKAQKVLFNGTVSQAVKAFPQNINVAATISLACRSTTKLKVCIVTSPRFKVNSHEIELSGSFGHIITRTDNVPCLDNPKTSYLAVLSAMQALKQYINRFKIGT